jgi:prepilin-type processing-associated H-X9-DG protein
VPDSSQYVFGSCRPDCGVDSSSFTNVTGNHSGGNVLMGDGRVTFVPSTIARGNWWSPGTKDKREVIRSDTY